MEPTAAITVILEAQQWELVLRQLAEGQFRFVAPLIQDIQRQCMSQPQPARGNGAAVETLHPVA